MNYLCRMNLSGLSACYAKSGKLDSLRGLLRPEGKKEVKVCVEGLAGSGAAAVLSGLMLGKDLRGAGAPKEMLVVMGDEREAVRMYEDLCRLRDDGKTLYFPAADRKNGESMMWRAEAAARAAAGEQGLVVVSHTEAVREKVEGPAALSAHTLRVEKGQTLTMSSLTARLGDMGMTKTDYVYSPGEWARRGSIVDIFPLNSTTPFRIDFFGNEVDTIRQFDVESQLSNGLLAAVNIVGKAEGDGKSLTTIGALMGKGSVIYYDTPVLLDVLLRERADDGAEADAQIATAEEWKAETAKEKILFGHEGPRRHADVKFDIRPEPRLLSTDEGNRRIRGLHRENEEKTLREEYDGITVEMASDGGLGAGFVDREMRVGAYSLPAAKPTTTWEKALLRRLGNTTLRSMTLKGEAARWMRAMREFSEGDYVVHSDHGVGQFVGLVEVDHWGGKPQQMMKLLYKDKAVVYVSVHAIGKVSKYKSATDEPPRLSTLGSGAWQRMKERTKKRVKDIAKDLITLYSKRLTEKGFAYSPDGELQQKLEASFPYALTPDQEKALKAVKKDMESPVPMDRLICGDVGFGKTEVAIRAAFKAAQDGKQVAVLVPTTVLAYQHFQTFSERLRPFPVTIAYLSRACTNGQVREIAEGLKNGRIDIVIGTHKLLSSKIEYHDLGLLIIDEEQKFGVATKEKLRHLRTNIDTLTLSATPIPRTLQFSLMGARDLSVIATPPLNRLPIRTDVYEASDEVISTAINTELSRDGQVFFVCNRIAKLPMLAERLRRVVPQARVGVGHGAMTPTDLEKVVMKFISHETDVLLSTTIIENGIDIPNANTIIIADAQNYGLSDLHQIRGRVGRTDRRAYCYLLTPPLETLSENARRRLEAIVGFTALGSGLRIAMQDLDIRGAGNVLGAEQSGFIAELGFDTYMRVLREAVGELQQNAASKAARERMRANRLQEATEEETTKEREAAWADDCTFDTDLPLFFPESYIPGNGERIAFYRELEQTRSEEGLKRLRARLEDRFGQLPKEAEGLLDVVRLRLEAMGAGVEKLILKDGKMTACFVGNDGRGFYQSDVFGRWLGFIGRNGGRCRLENQDSRAVLTVGRVATTAAAETIIRSVVAEGEEGSGAKAGAKAKRTSDKAANEGR